MQGSSGQLIFKISSSLKSELQSLRGTERKKARKKGKGDLFRIFKAVQAGQEVAILLATVRNHCDTSQATGNNVFQRAVVLLWLVQ